LLGWFYLHIFKKH